jgi:hypothetical protein
MNKFICKDYDELRKVCRQCNHSKAHIHTEQCDLATDRCPKCSEIHDTQKACVDIPVEDGWELTGEFRIPKLGEFYMLNSPSRCISDDNMSTTHFIVRKKKSVMRFMTRNEVLGFVTNTNGIVSRTSGTGQPWVPSSCNGYHLSIDNYQWATIDNKGNIGEPQKFEIEE